MKTKIEKLEEDIMFLVTTILIIVVLMAIFTFKNAESSEININKIIQIESSNNPIAYNRLTKAKGLMQITPICLKDYNDNHKKKYTSQQLFNPAINKIIGTWYLTKRIPLFLKHNNIKKSSKNILIAYHDGIGNLKKYLAGKRELGREMLGYLRKYKG